MKPQEFFLNFLFPKKCLGCGKKGNYFCSSCVREIRPLEPQIYLFGCSLDGLFCVFPYQGIIRRAILKLKYNFVSDLSEELVNLSLRLIKLDWFDFLNSITLIPIPLYWYREKWRGFNQTEMLGKKIADKLKIDFCSDLLIRIRLTKPQTKLKGKERKENIRGAFKVNPKYSILNTKYLLFDDVWTTGATMKECARVLKKAGAKKVFGLTLAR